MIGTVRLGLAYSRFVEFGRAGVDADLEAECETFHWERPFLGWVTSANGVPT
jgi:hypothetical protein